jgi:hypothetical protein
MEIMREKNKFIKISRFVLFFLFVINSGIASSQVTITGAQFSSYNLTPATMCNVSVMNNQTEMQAFLYVNITNSSNELLVTIETNPISLHVGVNIITGANVTFARVAYGSSSQAAQLQTMHMLPSGTYMYCCGIVGISSEGGDDYCEEFESEITSNLNLIYPDHQDTIETLNPVLVWSHSESFSMLTSSESFRLVLVEIMENQTADNAISVNSPLFILNNLNSHSIMYPIDATSLVKGKTYAWQVQKTTNGVATKVSEAWQFTIKNIVLAKNNGYALLKRKLDASFYTIRDGKLCFKFDEFYNGGNFSCSIYNWKREKISPIAKNNDYNVGVSTKKLGYNYFEIDLSVLPNLSSGYYTLEVINESKELLMLKFYIE